jgi:homoserine dehydrogenase
MLNVEILKFGSSVLRSPDDLPVAVDEIYRRWRSGSQVLAVVSAFEGVTDRLISEAEALVAANSSAIAAYIAQGEQRTAALLLGALARCGIPARGVEPRDIGLIAEGTPLESTPSSVDVTALGRLWNSDPVLVLPGFYGVDSQGSTALFGRGGSDLSALFLATALQASCRLLKDVSGVYDADPASSKLAHRFAALSWQTAVKVAGPLIQPKGLKHAQSHALSFYVGRPNERACTRVGEVQDEWEAPAAQSHRPMRVALLGCGVVGRGVYETLKHYPRTFEIAHVVVRDVSKHLDIPERTSDFEAAADSSIDTVVECCGGMAAYPLIAAALKDNTYVVTANKALIAAHWAQLSPFVHSKDRRLWYSAAVAGAVPALERLRALPPAGKTVMEIRGIINGTCGVVLDARAQGKTGDEAIALAKTLGFCEADPFQDLSGRDSADKLALMIEAAFGEWLPPACIATQGIDSLAGDVSGYKLVARARKTAEGIIASVAPEVPRPASILREAKGAENRIEIELKSGEVICLSGQGAGRWPTAVSVMGDLHEIARTTQAPAAVFPFPQGLPRVRLNCRRACARYTERQDREPIANGHTISPVGRRS